MNSKKRTLAIMAAGLGSRFGSLKQLYSISKDKYAILDYSIYDALSVGFNHIIIIVSQQTLEIFKIRYNGVLPNTVSIEFIVQNTPELSKKYPKRAKPFGTGHALLMLKNSIKDNFALINADDFYGRSAFQLMYNALYLKPSSQNYFIGYTLKNTLSNNGAVSRGECFLDSKKNLKTIKERTNIYKKDNLLVYKNENNTEITIDEETIVSMNFWGFTPNIFNVIETEFHSFLEKYGNSNTKEFYIATIVDTCINITSQVFKMIPTDSKWFGITYEADTKDVKNAIHLLIENSSYPETLW